MTVTSTYYYTNQAQQQTNECPQPGFYTLTTSFTVPSLRDFFFHYTPDIKLTFYNPYTGQRIGCATTGTVALHRVADRRATRGLVALGVAVVVFCVVFALLLYLSYKRKKRLEHRREAAHNKVHAATNYRYFRTLPSGQVIPLPAATTHHGGGGGGPAAAAAAAATTNGGSSSSNHANHHHHHGMSRPSVATMNISNPAYNETQIPTRPII